MACNPAENVLLSRHTNKSTLKCSLLNCFYLNCNNNYSNYSNNNFDNFQIDSTQLDSSQLDGWHPPESRNGRFLVNKSFFNSIKSFFINFRKLLGSEKFVS